MPPERLNQKELQERMLDLVADMKSSQEELRLANAVVRELVPLELRRKIRKLRKEVRAKADEIRSVEMKIRIAGVRENV